MVDECLPGWSDTWGLPGTTGEHHLLIGARLRGRKRNTSAKDGTSKAPIRYYDGTNETGEGTGDHVEISAHTSAFQTL